MRISDWSSDVCSSDLVRVAVADKNHLLEWDAQLVLGHLAVDLERFAARRLPDYAFLDMEQVARLVGEAHDTTRKFDGAIVAVVDFGSPDNGKFVGNRRMPDPAAHSSGDQVTLKLNPGMLQTAKRS